MPKSLRDLGLRVPRRRALSRPTSTRTDTFHNISTVSAAGLGALSQTGRCASTCGSKSAVRLGLPHSFSPHRTPTAGDYSRLVYYEPTHYYLTLRSRPSRAGGAGAPARAVIVARLSTRTTVRTRGSYIIDGGRHTLALGQQALIGRVSKTAHFRPGKRDKACTGRVDPGHRASGRVYVGFSATHRVVTTEARAEPPQRKTQRKNARPGEPRRAREASESMGAGP